MIIGYDKTVKRWVLVPQHPLEMNTIGKFRKKTPSKKVGFTMKEITAILKILDVTYHGQEAMDKKPVKKTKPKKQAKSKLVPPPSAGTSPPVKPKETLLL